MRITVDIDDKKVRSLMKEFGIRRKSPAVSRAVDECLRQRTINRVIAMVESGEVNYSTTNEEIEAMWADEAH